MPEETPHHELSKKEDRKDMIKGLIKKLHEGATPEEVKERFKEVIEGVTPAEIAQVEEELIREGMPREEIQRLCDAHLATFKESFKREKTLAPAGHPIHILMEEHKMLLKFADELKDLVKGLKENVTDEKIKHLEHIAEHLKESESHYLREENVLFLYLEKYGITQPPMIMWMEHDKIREIKKGLYGLMDAREGMDLRDFVKRLDSIATSLAEMLSGHFFKENNVLFPTSLKVIGEDEWREIRHEFDGIGYCCFTPEHARRKVEEVRLPVEKPGREGIIHFETGALSKEEVEAILNTLPVDVTFVDKDDTVRYFNRSEERIFVRTKAVIGRKVQQCHPQKSIHIVNRILEDFKSGREDVAEFWINFKGRLIHIRYFAVRDRNGEYLGCLEVTQDITDIKRIEGEKRLL